MPEGTPFRKSFAVIPKEKKHFWRPEALQLRKMFPFTGVLHACFVILDVVVFGDILLIISDVILVWLDFYNYMKLNKICVAVEVIIHLFTTLVAITHIQRGFSEDISNFMVYLFIVQMFIIYPVITILMGKRLNAHYQQQF